MNVGYSYSSLENLNNYWKKVRTDAEANTPEAQWEVYGNGVFVNVDLNINFGTVILAGVRTGLQYIFPSTYTGYRYLGDPVNDWVMTETAVDNYLVPIMAGINLYLPLGDDSPVTVKAAVYGGWGMAYCAQSTSYDGGPSLLALYGGNGFMADISAAVEMELLPFLSLSLNGGYRFADMSNFKTVESVSTEVGGTTYIVEANDPFNDGSGSPVNVDFSGINIGIGVKIRI